MDYDKKADIEIPDWVKRGLPTAQFGKPLPEPASDARELLYKLRAGRYVNGQEWESELDDIEAIALIESSFQARLAAQGQEEKRCIGAGEKIFEPLRKALDEAQSRAEKAESEMKALKARISRLIKVVEMAKWPRLADGLPFLGYSNREIDLDIAARAALHESVPGTEPGSLERGR